ncbi:hypothetical protein GCM10007874_54460 [Labrys miyagiensis]|uniref:Uncharacterized protein n=1 Tax=Labrys miyagiensis TaxID=346912 RepID=A0ABQ6CQ34_9HYPH|nr:hypothetical protein GCM10007874_54460 [Labrys miyagiensis]
MVGCKANAGASRNCGWLLPLVKASLPALFISEMFWKARIIDPLDVCDIAALCRAASVIGEPFQLIVAKGWPRLLKFEGGMTSVSREQPRWR